MLKFNFLLLSLSFVQACFGQKAIKKTEKANAPSSSIYQFKLPLIDGELFDFAKLEGKKIIIMNVASQCGYTSQYEEWQKFYEENKEKIEILAFPSNDFNQEKADNATIAAFCEKNYGVTFPVFEKIHIKGDQQNALYQWLTQKEKNGWNDQTPTWNFCKYAINEKGELQYFFKSSVTPESEEFKLFFEQK